MRFADRREAGQRLAAALHSYQGEPTLLVLALPRGGVPVACEVAQALHAPLDLLLVRKLGVPGHEELAMGAIADGGLRLLNRAVVDDYAIPRAAIEAVTAREEAELARRAVRYRGEHPPLPVRGRTVLLVDDGIATGSTMQVALAALRERGAARRIVAVPVAPPSAIAALRPLADAVVVLASPSPFRAVGLWYDDFAQLSDADVKRLLKGASAAT